LKTWKASPLECLKAITAQTCDEAIKSNSPALGFIFQDSEIKARGILTLLITDLVKSFNVGKTMNDFQIGQTINLILEDNHFRSFKPDDFKVCFTNMIKGYYGKSYDRIDTQIIFEGLNTYLEERLLKCEEISLQRHKLHKENKLTDINPEGQKKVLEILKSVIPKSESISTQKITDEIPLIKKKVVVKSERDIFIQNCFDDFFKLWKEEPFEPHKGKYLFIDGKPMDECQYVEWRLKDFLIKYKP